MASGQEWQQRLVETCLKEEEQKVELGLVLKNNFSYPKSCRVRDTKEFKFILRHGKKNAQRNLLFFTIKSKAIESKFGIIVSKKCHKSAVKRNKVQRINKEHFRHLQKKMLGFNIVVVAKPNIYSLSEQDIFAETKKQWDFFLKCLLK
jgi:ribonuclease P protein component